MPDHKPTEEQPDKPEQAKGTEETGEKKKKALDYDFKIVPVDPKNSFDFEDIADK